MTVRVVAEKPVPVLALGLARTTGWAFGSPEEPPLHGTHRFAAPDASHEAVFYKSMLWIQEMILKHKPGLIIWEEAPLSTNFTRGSTTSNTTTLLHGLPAIVGAISYMYNIFDLRKADKRVTANFRSGSPARRH
jgi:hypothetical protein